jgi:hypothetical protein
MSRKTLKHRTKKEKGVFSIPELRRSFEHIEKFVNQKISSRESKDQIVKDLKKEWSHTFFKELDTKSAEAYVSDRMSKKHTSRHRTLRKTGGAAAIAGAPLDYTTRAGIYLAPGQIPTSAGHLPLSDGSKSNFGSYVQYVDKGFWNPEPGQSYDPIPGQTRFPTSVPAGMGSNAVQKGGKRKSRKVRRGGALMPATISQAFMRPVSSSSSPPSILQDYQDMWYGKEVGPSPDQIQRGVHYKYN